MFVPLCMTDSEYSKRKEIDTGGWVNAMSFTANDEHVISGSWRGLGMWRVEDGKRVATNVNDANGVLCLAVSMDGKWIAGGSSYGEVLIWDARTYERVSAHNLSLPHAVYDVDFSPDSSSLVSAEGAHGTATIWDITARKKVQVLDHRERLLAAKYSPQGGRIATASGVSTYVWDSNDGRLLVNINVRPQPGRCLLWFKSHIFVTTDDSKIKEIDAATGSIVSEWSVPRTDWHSSIAMPLHGKFIAYSTSDSITIWDTSTHAQLGLIPQTGRRSLIVFSSDDHLAFVTQERKIIIDSGSINVPEIYICGAALDAWRHGQLANAEALLSAAIPTSKDTLNHILASRALIRAHLGHHDAALVDAKQSIKIQRSVVGYIAMCLALVGKGERDDGFRMCDIALNYFHSNYATLLLLIKAIVLFMAGKRDDAISRIDDLISTAYLDSTFYVIRAYMHFLFGNLHMESGNYQRAIQSFEDAQVKLGNCAHPPPLIVSLASGWKFDDLAITIQQRSCEALLLAGRAWDAGKSLLRIVDYEVNMTESIHPWICDLLQRCLSTQEHNGNMRRGTTSDHDTPTQEMSHVSCLVPLLRVWTRSRLTAGSWEDALVAAISFVLSRFTVYRVICEDLEMTGHVMDAVACLHQMCGELAQEIDGEQINWIREFKPRCCEKLQRLGDLAMNAKEYDEAILRYTAALSLEPVTPQDVLIERSKAYAGRGEWDNAVNDANEVIRLDPSSPQGYEIRHTALHGKGDYDDAIGAFETMLSKISQSSDPEVRKQHRRYVTPEQTRDKIRIAVRDTIRDSPLVLINIESGRLSNKSEQAAAFESISDFRKLISSMTTHIDHTSIEKEVTQFYRYATFSHKWEENEPLYEEIIKIVVYDLQASPTHDKLRMFCKIVREAGLNWAWSDTCCINQQDHFVLQEALVSMFKWYENSAITIIFLLGVHRLAQFGAMMNSIWNMRAWTLQEYHASKAVQFYTEDWTPYLGLTIYNHKESLEIIAEMEGATGISARALTELRPGLDAIREKLRLASTRETTRVEDAAYSLLGIFSMSMPILYGDGDKALGQLLAQLLTNSGDTTILAWTGISGSFNSCLPTSITVFSHLPTSHIPTIPNTDMPTLTAGLRSLNFTTVTRLYDRLGDLPLPSFSGRRMRLPCLAFKLRQLVAQNGSEHVFCAQTKVLGILEIRTEENLGRLDSLYLIHPWIDFLLDRHPVGNITATTTEVDVNNGSSVPGELLSSRGRFNTTPTIRQMRTAELMSRFGQSFGGRSAPDAAPLRSPSIMSHVERQARILEFVARLRQPFGALLLTPTRHNVKEYRRVAAESLIRVQVEEITSAILDKLMESVRMVDVL